jgi:hypothetical protein
LGASTSTLGSVVTVGVVAVCAMALLPRWNSVSAAMLVPANIGLGDRIVLISDRTPPRSFSRLGRRHAPSLRDGSISKALRGRLERTA